MICPKCNAQVNDNSKFCHACGAAMGGNDAGFSGFDEPTVSAAGSFMPNQPRPEQPADYQPQHEPPVSQVKPEQPADYMPQHDQPAYQQDVFASQPDPQPAETNPNAQYAQQFQQFQQSNQQFKNPNYVGQPYDQMNQPGMQAVKQKSKALPAVVISVVAVLAVIGIVIGVLFIFSGSGSEKIVTDFTEAINKRNVNLIKEDVLPEYWEAIESAAGVDSMMKSIPDGYVIETKVTSKEVIKRGDAIFDKYAKAIAEKAQSVSTEADITERNILAVSMTAKKDGKNEGEQTIYFDTMRIKGKWYFMNANSTRTSLDTIVS